LVEIERDAEIALGAHLYSRTRQAGCAHVLNRNDAALLHDLETSLEQQLFRERIADLHGWAFSLRVLIELRRGHRGAVDAVATGLGAEINDWHADARSRRVEDLVLARDADCHRVDQAVAVITRMESHRA